MSPHPTPPSPAHTPSRFVRLARVCNRHRWRTFGAWVLAVILLLVIGSSVGTKEISNYRLPNTESQRAYDLLNTHLPAAKGDTDQFVFKATTGTLRDGENRKAVEAALAAMKRGSDVAGVESPFAPGGQLTEDGRTGVAFLTYSESTNDLELEDLEKIESSVFAQRSASLQIEHGGPGAQFVRFSNQEGDIGQLVGFVAAALVLLLTFGSAIAAGIPLLAAALAIAGTVGTISLISQIVDTPDFATQLAELIGIGVGIDYAMFVVTRYRAEIAAGRDPDEAIETAIDTAGRTVMFAAFTVVIALLGLLLLGLNFMHGVALGAGFAVLATMFAALTLLPALIGGSKGFLDGVFGELSRRGGARVLPIWKQRVRLPGGSWFARRSDSRKGRQSGSARWEAWSTGVQRRPWLAAGVATVVLLAIAFPALDMRLGSSDAGVDPKGTTTRDAYHLIADGFGPGVNGSFLVVAELDKKGDKAAAAQVTAALKKDRDFVSVGAPTVSPDGAIATVTAFPRTGPQDERTTETLRHLRDDIVPPLEKASGTTVEVGGFTAGNEDFSEVVAGKLPLFVGVVVLLSALLLMAVFRSVLIPIKAALMNLLSIGASLGFITLIFQDGHGADLLGVETGPIESFVPVLMFAIVFGLSMDYEVFLMSRVHEEWERAKDASGAITRGLATTGRVITAAASIMIVVFLAFVLADDRFIKLFGIGLASAVFFDAVIIRCLLVPAIMEILGRRAWWLPGWLDRVVPRLAIERTEDTGTSRGPELTKAG
ncbi:MMPL family transporter [Paraconexibacter sp. AEG42_29]|uniref:MMPL family transporter n=1 Tax=Paraconexibacter sp. AEG42_29 TaxID=2997339 RepID=UPI00339D84F7